MDRDDWLCQQCQRKGCITPATEVDHITPKAKGGAEDSGNLEAICGPCHKAKTEAEAAEAQGRRVRPRVADDGWPVA
ncbi:MAG: HNH endonuclease [Chloroflexi bacterium]|nr:HNH endonuclease [Chloroflexota bacterium]